MSETQRLMRACLDEVNSAWDFAVQKYGIDLYHVPVEFNARFTTKGGDCHVTQAPGGPRCVKMIRLSLKLLLQNGDEFVKYVPKHEAAHAIAFVALGSRGHDYLWQRVAIELGIPPVRCHSFKVETKRRKRVDAYCACGPHPITTIKQGRITMGAKYRCVKCRELVRLTP